MHRTIRAVVALAALVLAVAGCSSGGSDGSDDAASKAFAKAVNAVCKDGKTALSEVPLSVDVVPEPKTEAQREAGQAWARDTASELEAIAGRLRRVEASGDAVESRRELAAVYAAAAARVREEGTAVLADQDFLADDALHEAGFTSCVAAERG